MSSAAVESYRATNVPVLDIHEIVVGKVVALVTRRARSVRCASDHRHVRSGFDEDQGGHLDDRCECQELRLAHSLARCDRVRVGDITGKLTMCLHDRYFDAFGGPAAWIESVTAECRKKLAPVFPLTAGERAFLDAVLERGEIDVSSLDAPQPVRAAIEASPALRWKAQNVKAWKSAEKSLAPRTRRGPQPERRAP